MRENLIKRFARLERQLEKLEAECRAVGEKELADVAKRAHREFKLPALTGAVNTLGVNHSAVRE
jgi:hypothetical protein